MMSNERKIGSLGVKVGDILFRTQEPWITSDCNPVLEQRLFDQLKSTILQVTEIVHHEDETLGVIAEVCSQGDVPQGTPISIQSDYLKSLFFRKGAVEKPH